MPHCRRLLDLMVGGRDRGLVAALAAIVPIVGGCLDAAAQAPVDRVSACGGDIIARGTADRIIDGRTFVLADGREVRLAGIEVPPLPPSPQPAQSKPGDQGIRAKAALAALLDAAAVVLKRADIPSDRYGRVIAYAFIVTAQGERLVQAELLAAGLARVGSRIGTLPCAGELLGLEKAARRAKLGLWADPYYDLVNADNPSEVLAERGRFALVEGKVVSVRESGATIYVNFGRRWTEDFTVTIPKRNERSFTAAGLEPRRLAGRRVRVRGWIEERGGPWIEAVRPEQIELTDRD